MTSFLEIFAAVLITCNSLLSISLFRRPHWPAAGLWIMKLYVSALSPLLVFAGVMSVIVGLAAGSILISVIGSLNVLTFLVHIFRVTRAWDASRAFEEKFGVRWNDSTSPEQHHFFLTRRGSLRLPTVPNPQLEQNVEFSTIPATGRKLLCDMWRPHKSVTPSGVAFIYLHGSAWYILDKDCGTRPLFTHLTALGHVVMDVAYRLAPETDMMGMVHDVKRAIAWMKENAGAYGVDPRRIVVGGGSAGGHLALLAAYTANEPQFTPAELDGKELGACAVISLYGPTDLQAMYYHTNQHLTTRSIPGIPKKPVPTKIPGWMIKKMGKDYYRLGFDKPFENVGALATLMGGHPNESLETYILFSPLNHVHHKCPPTLLIHGEHDVMAPVGTTRFLHMLLDEEKVPTVIHTLPQTDHAFDLILPNISPSAHNAFYDVERFLALVTRTKVSQGRNTGHRVAVRTVLEESE